MTALFWSASSLRGDALLVGGDQDRRAVLVGAGDHEHVVPGHPHVAAEDVGGHAETGHVADVARAVGVRPGDGGQDSAHGSNPRRAPELAAVAASATTAHRRSLSGVPRSAPLGPPPDVREPAVEGWPGQAVSLVSRWPSIAGSRTLRPSGTCRCRWSRR